MPEAGPYFEALSQHLAEYNDAPVLDGYTYLKRTIAEVVKGDDNQSSAVAGTNRTPG
jgi:hypothetical protein